MIFREKLRSCTLIHALSLHALVALGPACGSPTLPSPHQGAQPRVASEPAVVTPSDDRNLWARHTSAPVPGAPERRGQVQLPCRADGALERAARRLLDDPDWAEGGDLLPSFVKSATRAEGSPYVRPRAARFSAESSRALDAAVNRFREGLEPSRQRRCGQSGVKRVSDRHQLAVVIADAPASLAPLPTRVARGEDISFAAELSEPATRVELTVLEPDGQVNSRLIDASGSTVRTHFALYQRGKHVVQLLADLPGGPEPVLEAWIFVDEAPHVASTEPIPGAALARSSGDARTRLWQMANAARHSRQLRALRNDPWLASLAQQHAEAMRDASTLAHDLGTGGPVARIETAGVTVLAAGENLARATSVMGAHRAIWESPAHRSNLLSGHYDAIGIGLAKDERGVLWLCQLLADYP